MQFWVTWQAYKVVIRTPLMGNPVWPISWALSASLLHRWCDEWLFLSVRAERGGTSEAGAALYYSSKLARHLIRSHHKILKSCSVNGGSMGVGVRTTIHVWDGSVHATRSPLSGGVTDRAAKQGLNGLLRSHIKVTALNKPLRCFLGLLLLSAYSHIR